MLKVFAVVVDAYVFVTDDTISYKSYHSLFWDPDPPIRGKFGWKKYKNLQTFFNRYKEVPATKYNS